MHRAESPKPPLAPKPKTARPLSLVATPTIPASPGPGGPSSMSRGPKPPLAPKPRLAAPGGCRGSVHLNSSLSPCSNGRLLCGLGDLRPSLDCSESEPDEDYIVAPKAPGSGDMPEDGARAEAAAQGASAEERDQETGADQDRASPAAPADGELRSEDQDDTEDRPAGEDDGDNDPGMEEEEEEHNAYNLVDGGPWGGAEVLESDSILSHVDSDAAPCETLEEAEETEPAGAEPGEPGQAVGSDIPAQDTGQEAEGADGEESLESGEEPLESEEVSIDVQEPEMATDPLEISQEACEEADQVDQGDWPSHQGDQGAMAAGAQEAEEDPEEGVEALQEDPADESCQIIPFESDSVDDLVTSLSGSPYEFFPTESTSFCSESYCPESEQARPSGVCAQEGPCGQRDSEEGPPVPDVVVESEDDSLSNPYVMGVGLACPADPGGPPEPQAALDALSDSAADAASGLVPLDRKNLVNRARSHSGKVAGYVPETVPEEMGPEAGSPAADVGGAAEEAGTALPMAGKALEASRALPAKPRAFTLYPRSFSVEGREVPFSIHREPEGAGMDNHRIKRKDDNLSLPCVIGSSGSFSQRSHLPSSGTSTPSSMVDIPPPFDLACITKKPITKSSPSLLIESDSPDKYAAKKKKSSFKRFLALTFKKKTETKVHVDVSLSSSRSSSESSYHGPCRILEIDRRSLSNSPQLKSRTGKLRASESPSSLIFYRDGKRKGVPFSRTVSRVESFEDRSRPSLLPLPLTKPRSISFPNADTSDYENIPAMNSDYENIQIPPRRPARAGTLTKLFEEQSRALSTASENDGYVDMSSFSAFENKPQGVDQDAESAYTEPYKVCPISTAAPREDLISDEEQGTSGEEDSAPRDPGLTHKVEGPSRALVIAQELLSSEKAYVQMLKHLSLEFHGAVTRALDDMDQDGHNAVAQEELRQGLSQLPAIHDLHQGILEELEDRLSNWEEQQKVADIFLAREQEFEYHATHILQFDRCLGLLTENCLCSPRLASAVHEFEQSQQGGGLSVQHRLLRVVQRLFQYQVLLTDYLNNLCPDSAEYDNTQGALTLISKVTDRASDGMEQGENLQKLVHIEHSVGGREDLLQPGREFLKEGTLMKVRGGKRHPRHLFLMSDVLLYTYPQKDRKYRLKSSLAVANMKVSRPVMEKVPYALKIETPESCLLLSAGSYAERDDWYSCLNRAIPEDCKTQALAAFHHSVEIRERQGVSLGERPPKLVPATDATRCMNCGCDFSLMLRGHHCRACGKIVCRNCSRNKYPLKYLKDQVAKVCDGCFGELKKRGGAIPGPMRERPVSMSFALSSPRFSSGSALSSVFHSINPSAFKKQKKVPSALTEVAASGEGSAISGYLSRCQRGRRPWKKLWFVIKGKVLYTYVASEDKVAVESIPLLGFTVAPEKEKGSREVGPVFHLYHKKTLFYSFKAEDTSSAQRWVKAMEDASVL